VTKTMNAKSAEIAMCEISIGSELSDQEMIWTVDLTSSRRFGDRDL
jgi:hypothetical protein